MEGFRPIIAFGVLLTLIWESNCSIVPWVDFKQAKIYRNKVRLHCETSLTWTFEFVRLFVTPELRISLLQSRHDQETRSFAVYHIRFASLTMIVKVTIGISVLKPAFSLATVVQAFFESYLAIQKKTF